MPRRRSRRLLVVAAPAGAAGPPAPLDPQNWSFQDNLTWADYKPVPGPNYSDPSDPADRQEVEGRADPRRLPGPAVHGHARPRAATSSATRRSAAPASRVTQVPQFYADFLNKPTALNNFQTMNRYWMEDSFGRYGVELVPFGPYRMPLKSWQYHIGNFQNVTQDCPNPNVATPNPEPCGQDFFAAARNAWNANTARRRAGDVRQPVLDLRGPGRVGRPGRSSARCASSTRTRSPTRSARRHINPLHPRGNWASTRYIPWTSWAAAANVWPSAAGTSSTEAESAGMAVYAHELSHNLGIPDNYNNPFTAPYQRTASRHVGHDEPRLVQRPGRPAHPLADPADPGLRARRAAQHAQQALPELHRRQRHPAPEPLRPRPDGPRRGGDQGA